MLARWRACSLLCGDVRRRLSPHIASVAVSAIYQQRRCRSFHFYFNKNDPDETKRHVEEDLARIEQEHQHGTMKHFHALLNLALAYYQSGDYISAYKYAEHTHEKTLEMNKNATLLFFTATTCAYCARAVADAYETSLSEAQEASSISVSLAPPPSAVFSAQRAISKLREDAKRYDGIAQRMLKRPDKAFMRQKEAGRGWSEDAGRGDGEAQEPFGKEWKDRRKQPEYAAIRRDQMRRCGGNVPK